MVDMNDLLNTADTMETGGPLEFEFIVIDQSQYKAEPTKHTDTIAMIEAADLIDTWVWTLSTSSLFWAYGKLSDWKWKIGRSIEILLTCNCKYFIDFNKLFFADLKCFPSRV